MRSNTPPRTNNLPPLQPISPSEQTSARHPSHFGDSLPQPSVLLWRNSSLQPESPGFSSSPPEGPDRKTHSIIPQENIPKPETRKRRRKAESSHAVSKVRLMDNPSASMNIPTIPLGSPEKRGSDPLELLANPIPSLVKCTRRKPKHLAGGSHRSQKTTAKETRENKSFTFSTQNPPRPLDEPTASSKQLSKEFSNSPFASLPTEHRKPPISPSPPDNIFVNSAAIPVADDKIPQQPSVPYFFTWSPPSEVDGKAKISGSSGSRPPRFWDRHLHEKFILKKVHAAPNLATLLGEVADTALKEAQARYSTAICPSQLTKENLTNSDKYTIRLTDDELGVQRFYGSSIAPLILSMAHALLGHETPLKNFFIWKSKCKGQTKAQADGFLTVNNLANQSFALPNELEKYVKLLEEWNLSNLSLWEFKSLAAGSSDVMEAIQRLPTQKDFPWTGCTTISRCESALHKGGEVTINTGRRTGPDALSPLGVASPPETRKRSHDVMSGSADVVNHHVDEVKDGDSDDELCYDDSAASSFDVDDGTPENNISEDGGKDELVDGESCFATDDPVILESKKAQRLSAKGAQALKKASHIIQQVWAEAVQNDATFMIVNAGRYEFIAYRCREKQALYLSDMIEVCNSSPAYGKLHTGLYLAAFNDALDRASQLDHLKASRQRFGPLYRRKYSHDKVNYTYEDPNDIASQKQEELELAQKGSDLHLNIGETLRRCRTMKVYAKEVPIFGAKQFQHFYRHHDVALGEELEAEHDPPKNLCLHLKELLAGAVYTCVVCLDDRTSDDRFVIKLVQEEGCEALLQEYKTYLALKAAKFEGIVEVHGVFQCDAQGMPVMGLVMSYGGCSMLQGSRECRARVRRNVVSERFEAIVKELRRHNLVHRRLRLDHLLLHKSKGPDNKETLSLSLVGWKLAKTRPPQPATLPEAAKIGDTDDPCPRLAVPGEAASTDGDRVMERLNHSFNTMPEATEIQKINSVYEHNPPVLRQAGNCIHPPSALTFYDKHLHPSLLLRHVRILPSIVADLSDIATDLVADIIEHNLPLPFMGNIPTFFEPHGDVMQDASDVGNHYVNYISEPCCALGSTLAFHPNCSQWVSIMNWDNRVLSTNSFATDGYSLRLCRGYVKPLKLYLPPVLQKLLQEDAKDELRQLLAAFPDLITGQMLAVTEEAKELVKRLWIPSMSNFFWVTPGTTGQLILSPLDSKLCGPDAQSIPSVHKKATSSHRSYSPKPHCSSRILPPPRIGTKRGRSYDPRPDPSHYIQHVRAFSIISYPSLILKQAWVQSVVQDTTFILFHCGKYDRIGVRHRATQTLYLSEAVDVNTCQDPAYGKLQVGLYVTALRDARGRLARLKASAASVAPIVQGRKRSLPDNDNETQRQKKRNKRRPHDQEAAEVDNSDKLFMEEVGHRDLALVRLEYSFYSSPVSASFLRSDASLVPGENPAPFKSPKRKAGYTAVEYISVTLGDQIGEGIIGVVHRGTLSLRTTHATLTRQVAAKLAFSKEQQRSLRHEFTIYTRLWQRNVKGILPVYGLFQDMEDGPLMLLLGYGGISLFSREQERMGSYSKCVTCSDSERGFVEALKSIHNAGVGQGDVRPHNMLVNGTDVYFIDFHYGFVGNHKAHAREERLLKDILEGEEWDSEG
ncbi:uncharacterized protein LACBIDRAFT_327453 [Laccaria bicolor S238N-H82]|uniref:Predicted protein n=1 Tax=Laccaria bicolor (strain S238N-H82 / ATCC MYA-4686) TaxID=486041 RepID=B0DB47_LACBS|nr:uncharacterized protein LACBIDRAFT_327453 [Laccaria bicolor S238N-H82]EDR08325.1 predicted protein [Laccaria bicolor S238N-H82]|eukprot:XP_001881395.1 predicted protein [Laccaria bicolor S238N-H82]